MPVIRATDIVDIMAADTEDEQTIATYRDMAFQITNDIRKQAELVVCIAEDMELAPGRTNLFRLPNLALAPSAQPLNTAFHQKMVC